MRHRERHSKLEWLPSDRKVFDEKVERSLRQAALWEEVKDDLKKKSGRIVSRAVSNSGSVLRARWRSILKFF